MKQFETECLPVVLPGRVGARPWIIGTYLSLYAFCIMNAPVDASTVSCEHVCLGHGVVVLFSRLKGTVSDLWEVFNKEIGTDYRKFSL